MYTPTIPDSSKWGVDSFIRHGNKFDINAEACKDEYIENGIACSSEFVVATVTFSIQVGPFGDVTPDVEYPHTGVYAAAVSSQPEAFPISVPHSVLFREVYFAVSYFLSLSLCSMFHLFRLTRFNTA
jgi:hypothetical protein